MKKKIIGMALVLFMVLALVACGEASIKVEFETNGGSAVQTIELDEKSVGQFVIPEEPTKAGYYFDGWYVDAEFKNEFDKIDFSKGNVKLYAKWLSPQEAIVGYWIGAGFYMEFNADGTCISHVSGASEATYTIDGNTLTITAEGESLNATFNGKEIILNVYGIDYKFEKMAKINLDAVELPTAEKLQAVLTSVKGFTYDGKIKVDYEAKMSDMVGTITVDYDVKAVIEKFDIESFADLNAYIKLSGDVAIKEDGVAINDTTAKAIIEALKKIEVYIKNGVAYLNMSMPTETEQGMTNVPLAISVDLEQVVGTLLTAATTAIGQFDIESMLSQFGIELDFTDPEGMINTVCATLLSYLAALGINQSKLYEILALAYEYLPTVTVNGKSTSIEYTKAGILKALNDTVSFANNNKALITSIAVMTGARIDDSDFAAVIDEVKEIITGIENMIELNKCIVKIEENDVGLPTIVTEDLDGKIYMDDAKATYVKVVIGCEHNFGYAESTITFPELNDYTDFTDTLLTMLSSIGGEISGQDKKPAE